MNAATIGAPTIRLRASGAGSDVAAAITYDAGTRTATLNPDGDLALDTDYAVTVAGSVADAGSNPLGADVTWTFHTVPAPPLLDATVADFAAGTPGACYVSQTADGEIILSPTVGTEFSGTTQPAGWGAAPWTGGSATFNGSAATVDGARLATDASFTQGRSLEFVATFGAATFQNVGFGQLLDSIAGEYWAMFGTWSATNTLYAHQRQRLSSRNCTGRKLDRQRPSLPHRLDRRGRGLLDRRQRRSHPERNDPGAYAAGHQRLPERRPCRRDRLVAHDALRDLLYLHLAASWTAAAQPTG